MKEREFLVITMYNDKENIDISTELEEECTKIDVLSAEIETCLKSILELKDQKVCPKCNKTIDKTSAFCPYCGEKQPESECNEEAKEPEVILEKLESVEINPENEAEKEIVKEKYILAIGATIFGGLLGILLTILVVNVMNYIRPENMINLDYKILITTALGGIFCISLLQAIQIPSVFKWGAEKGRIQMFISLFIIIAVIGGIYFLVTKFNININIEMLSDFINKFGLIILIALMIIMYFVSYKIAYKIYRNKEE